MTNLLTSQTVLLKNMFSHVKVLKLVPSINLTMWLGLLVFDVTLYGLYIRYKKKLV